MILFYWTNVHSGAVNDLAPSIQSARIFVNIDLAARWSVGFGKMAFTLDCLSLWGGADKSDKCVDGTTTVSWEFPGDRYPLVQSIVEKWKMAPPAATPAWCEESFFFKEAKQPV